MTTKSSTALVEATGRDYGDWFAALDEWGAAEHTSREAMAWLHDVHEMSTWWAQKLVVEYEQVRGTRVPGARPDGTVTIGTSRTVSAPLSRTFDAVVEFDQRARWLPDVELVERTSTTGRSARFDGPDGTRVNVTFQATRASATAVSIEQERLPLTVDQEVARAEWKRRLHALEDLLAEPR